MTDTQATDVQGRRQQLLLPNPVRTVPIFGPDGNVLGYKEQQTREDYDRAFRRLRDADEFQKPLIGNTQRHWRHVGEVPRVIVNDLMRRGIWQDPDARQKWLMTEGRNFMFRGKI